MSGTKEAEIKQGEGSNSSKNVGIAETGIRHGEDDSLDTKCGGVSEKVSSNGEGQEIGERKIEKGDTVIDSEEDNKVETAQNQGTEKICRICQLNDEGKEIIELGCDCKSDLRFCHRHCAEVWFNRKRSRVCEICGMIAKNVQRSEGRKKNGVERKIWGTLTVLFLIVGVSALGTAWLVSTVAALVLGQLLVVRCDFSDYMDRARAFLAFRPYSNACEGFGTMLVMVLGMPLMAKDAEIPVYLFVAVSAATLSIFCLLMMMRPVYTDFGLPYALCVILISGNFASELKWSRIIVCIISCLMTIARSMMIVEP